jgi:hypothetical protein
MVVLQDRPTADEIPAHLDRLALDEIDGAPKKPFERVLQVAERRKIVSGDSLEGDKEISVAAVGTEIGSPRSRAEDLQPRHAITTADRRKSVALFVNVSLHGFLPTFRNPCSTMLLRSAITASPLSVACNRYRLLIRVSILQICARPG